MDDDDDDNYDEGVDACICIDYFIKYGNSIEKKQL